MSGRQLLALVSIGLATALLVVYGALWLGFPGAFRTGNDFAPTYVAGELVRHGNGAAIYDQNTVYALENAHPPRGYVVHLPFISPPAAALIAAPFSLLSLPLADVVWSLIQVLAVIASAVLIAARVRWPSANTVRFRAVVVAGAASAPALGALLLFGQSDGLFVLGLAVGFVAWSRNRPIEAGVALGLGAGLSKPHLMVGVLAFFLLRREIRLVAVSLATAALVNLLALLVLGPSAAGGFLSAVTHSGADHPISSLVGVSGLLGSWLGNGAAVQTAALIVSALLIALCARLGALSRREKRDASSLLAAALAVGLLASPHLLVYDMVALVPAFVWTYPAILTSRSHTDSWRQWLPAGEAPWWAAWTGIGLAVVFDVVANGSVGPPGRLLPWGLVAFALMAWRASVSCGSRRRLSQPSEPRGMVGKPVPSAA
jgi:hypothetical protein